MPPDQLTSLLDPGIRPTSDETDEALSRVRHRHRRRQLAVRLSVTAVVVAALAGVGLAVAGDRPQRVDTTSATQLAPSPGPLSLRTGASVAWTGGELIVTGGFLPSPSNNFDQATFMLDGAAYNPGTDEWRPIAARPAGDMTWPFSAWTGEEMLVVGTAGGFAYSPATDEWRILPDLPFALPDLVRDNERFEAAWSGDALYLWRPSTDEMARYRPNGNRWELMAGPGLAADPAQLLAAGDRLVALGTGWPSSSVGTSFDVTAAEWDGQTWLQRPPVTFVTASNMNTADVGAAALVGDQAVVWGDHSVDPGPTYLLDRDGRWCGAPPMPVFAGIGHPGSVLLDGRVLALTEGTEASIFDPAALTWTITELPAAGPLAAELAWTGTELLGWNGSDVWRWVPPAAVTADDSDRTVSAGCLAVPTFSSGSPDEPQPLADIAANGVRYELRLFPNSQGPEAPCVGLSHSNADGGFATMACPTEEHEVTTYAATIQAGSGFFVVGYGTEAGETITTDEAIQTTISQDQDGRHYFAIELRASPGPDPFNLKVTSPDGSTRLIPCHGLAT